MLIVSIEIGSRPFGVNFTVRSAVFIWGETEAMVPWTRPPFLSSIVVVSFWHFMRNLGGLVRDGKGMGKECGPDELHCGGWGVCCAVGEATEGVRYGDGLVRLCDSLALGMDVKLQDLWSCVKQCREAVKNEVVKLQLILGMAWRQDNQSTAADFNATTTIPLLKWFEIDMRIM